MNYINKYIRIKAILLFIIVIINYVCLWYLFSMLGINEIHPIGFKDSFGLVFPPNWFILVITIFSLIEFIVLTTFFSFRHKK
jgi:hypothetical protein